MAIVINSTTGEIDLDQTTPGTYVVTYTVQGVSSNQEVTVNAVDNAGFSYSSSSYAPTDADPTPSITGLTGGTFSGTTGLVINSTTGEIDLSASTVATHTITYDTTSSGSSVCPNTSTQTVEIALAGIANNYSMNFDSASSDYIDIGTTPNTGDISISFWVKHSTGGICVIASGDGVFNYLRFWNEQKVSIIIANQKYYLTTDIKDGNWHHVVVTNDTSANEIKGYTDGSLTQTHSLSVNSNNVKTIGAYQNGSLWFFNGAIDEVGIWNTVLTSTQISEIYNATSTNLTKDLTTVSGSNLIYWNRMGDN